MAKGDPASDWWTIFFGFASLAAMIWGLVIAASWGRVKFVEWRCGENLASYLQEKVPARRGAEIERCEVADASKGHCFVSYIEDGGARVTVALAVAWSAPDGLDVNRFLDDVAADKKTPDGVVNPLLDAIIASEARPR